MKQPMWDKRNLKIIAEERGNTLPFPPHIRGGMLAYARFVGQTGEDRGDTGHVQRLEARLQGLSSRDIGDGPARKIPLLGRLKKTTAMNWQEIQAPSTLTNGPGAALALFLGRKAPEVALRIATNAEASKNEHQRGILLHRGMDGYARLARPRRFTLQGCS